MDREVKFFQVILYCGQIQYLARNSHQMEHILLFISSNILYLLPWSLQSHPLFHSTSLLFKIHQKCLFVARPLCSSLSFLAEAQPRTRGSFWQKCTFNFLVDRANYKAKDIIGKITNFCICYQLANEDRNVLFFAIQLLI
jgi:hypothetical protein